MWPRLGLATKIDLVSPSDLVSHPLWLGLPTRLGLPPTLGSALLPVTPHSSIHDTITPHSRRFHLHLQHPDTPSPIYDNRNFGLRLLLLAMFKFDVSLPVRTYVSLTFPTVSNFHFCQSVLIRRPSIFVTFILSQPPPVPTAEDINVHHVASSCDLPH